MSTPFAPAVGLLPTIIAAAVAVAWALLLSTSTGCGARYSLLVCLCCATLLQLRSSYFFAIPPPGTTPSILPGSPICPLCSAKLQTVPTFLQFGLLFTNIYVVMNIMVFPTGEGGRGWKRAALLVPCSLPPSPFPCFLSWLLYMVDLPPTPTDNLKNRKPIRKPRSTPAPTLFYPHPLYFVPCPGCLLGAPDLPTKILDPQRGVTCSASRTPSSPPFSSTCSNLQSPHISMYGKGMPLVKN